MIKTCGATLDEVERGLLSRVHSTKNIVHNTKNRESTQLPIPYKKSLRQAMMQY